MKSMKDERRLGRGSRKSAGASERKLMDHRKVDGERLLVVD